MILNFGSLKFIITFIVVVIFEYRTIRIDAGFVKVRNKHKLLPRSLLFPTTAPTRVQLIVGIGIPVEDLFFESVTSGYVLKAQYLLPEKAEVYRQKIVPQSIHRRRKSVNGTTHIFNRDLYNVSLLNDKEKGISRNETLHFDQNIRPKYNQRYKQKHGTVYRWLVYKTIETILNKSVLNGRVCMLRSICEHAAIPLRYEGGLLAEIIHIILTPSTSRDECVAPYQQEYMKAESLGRMGKDCGKTFGQCNKSPMKIISAVFDT